MKKIYIKPITELCATEIENVLAANSGSASWETGGGTSGGDNQESGGITGSDDGDEFDGGTGAKYNNFNIWE